jgi:hypothetical protein
VTRSDATITLHLRLPPGSDGIRGLRWLLKLALRKFNIRCVAITPAGRQLDDNRGTQ